MRAPSSSCRLPRAALGSDISQSAYGRFQPYLSSRTAMFQLFARGEDQAWCNRELISFVTVRSLKRLHVQNCLCLVEPRRKPADAWRRVSGLSHFQMPKDGFIGTDGNRWAGSPSPKSQRVPKRAVARLQISGSVVAMEPVDRRSMRSSSDLDVSCAAAGKALTKAVASASSVAGTGSSIFGETMIVSFRFAPLTGMGSAKRCAEECEGEDQHRSIGPGCAAFRRTGWPPI